MQGKSIQFAQWDITGICNLRCKHCRAWKLSKNDELSTQEGLHLLEQLYKLKTHTLNLSGGEPFLRKDIFLLLDYAKNFGSVTVTTNGIVLDNKKIIKKIKTIKNLRISLSLDGMEKFHDNFRGVAGTFQKAVSAIKFLTQELIPTSIKFTLTKSNQAEVLKVFNLVSQYKIESFNIRSVLPAGRAKKSLMPSSETYIEVLNKLLKASKHKKIPVISADPILVPLFPELLGTIWQNKIIW